MNKLLLALAIVAGTGSLHGMESQELCVAQPNQKTLISPEITPSPMSLPQTYHQLANLLLPDIAQHIFLLQLKESGVDLAELPKLIEQSCKNPTDLVLLINLILSTCGYELAAELFERYFPHATISICDIKDNLEWTPLHVALYCDPESVNIENMVKILIKIAGSHTWKLLSARSIFGKTALHHATRHTVNNAKVIPFLLAVAGDNAQDFIAMQSNNGQTAFEQSSIEIPAFRRMMYLRNKIEKLKKANSQAIKNDRE